MRVAPEPDSPFNDTMVAAAHNVGVDGYLFGLWRISKKGWQRFARGHWDEFSLPSRPHDIDLRIDSIVEDSKQRLWYRFKHDLGTYYCLRGRLTKFACMPAKSFVSYQDSQGNLWESAHDGQTLFGRTAESLHSRASPHRMYFGDSKTGKDRFGWERPSRDSFGPSHR